MNPSEGQVYQWGIVGAGIHGSHLAICLRAAGVASEDLILLDRGGAPLELWTERTSRTGMTSLRSPGVHGLGVCPYALFDQAERLPNGTPWPLHPPYERPGYSYFQEHCRQEIEASQLDKSFLSCEVLGLEGEGDAYRLNTDGQPIRARRVILAVGQTAPHIPPWSAELPRVGHIFDPIWEERDEPEQVVIGSGLTAAQTALRLAQRQPVVLLCRHPWRVFDFDSDPCWLGPKCANLRYFGARPEDKRRIISAARHKGSVTPEIKGQLDRAERNGSLRVLQNEVLSATENELRLCDGSTLSYSWTTLATGFAPGRPGGALVDKAVSALKLPTSDCGFPLLDEDLQWRERLFVSGGLAELSIGPIARNISGAREAALRILGSLHPRADHRRRRSQLVAI